MKVDFSGDEIKVYDFDELEAYKIARKLESDGVYYYTRMREEVLKPEIREVLDMLLSDERGHLNMFEKRIAEICGERHDVDEDETLADIVDSHVMDVLKDSGRVTDVLCDPQEALRLGMAIEKRSIVFYSNLLKSTQDESGKAALEDVIGEEREHLDKLKSLLRQ